MRRVLGFSLQSTAANSRARGNLAKVPKERKPPPEPNEEAVRRMAEEKRRSSPVPVPHKYSAKRSHAVEEAFLDGLRGGWSVKKSAWAVGIETTTANAWKRASEASLDVETGIYKDDFTLRWVQAHEDGCDVLEDEAHRRGVEGVDRPVYQGGVMVGTVTEYSDTLLNLKLRGKRPGVYNTERHELTGANGGPMAMSMAIEFVDAPGKKDKPK